MFSKKQEVYEAGCASCCWQEAPNLLDALDRDILIYSFSSPSYDRSKTYSKASFPTGV